MPNIFARRPPPCAEKCKENCEMERKSVSHTKNTSPSFRTPNATTKLVPEVEEPGLLRHLVANHVPENPHSDYPAEYCAEDVADSIPRPPSRQWFRRADDSEEREPNTPCPPWHLVRDSSSGTSLEDMFDTVVAELVSDQADDAVEDIALDPFFSPLDAEADSQTSLDIQNDDAGGQAFGHSPSSLQNSRTLLDTPSRVPHSTGLTEPLAVSQSPSYVKRKKVPALGDDSHGRCSKGFLLHPSAEDTLAETKENSSAFDAILSRAQAVLFNRTLTGPGRPGTDGQPWSSANYPISKRKKPSKTSDSAADPHAHRDERKSKQDQASFQIAIERPKRPLPNVPLQIVYVLPYIPSEVYSWPSREMGRYLDSIRVTFQQYSKLRILTKHTVVVPTHFNPMRGVANSESWLNAVVEHLEKLRIGKRTTRHAKRPHYLSLILGSRVRKQPEYPPILSPYLRRV